MSSYNFMTQNLIHNTAQHVFNNRHDINDSDEQRKLANIISTAYTAQNSLSKYYYLSVTSSTVVQFHNVEFNRIELTPCWFHNTKYICSVLYRAFFNMFWRNEKFEYQKYAKQWLLFPSKQKEIPCKISQRIRLLYRQQKTYYSVVIMRRMQSSSKKLAAGWCKFTVNVDFF